MRSSTRSASGHKGLLLLLISAIILLVLWFPPSAWVPVQQLGAYLEQAGLVGLLIFAVVGVSAVSLGFPRQVIAFTGGLVYGTVPGLLLSLAIALTGCYLTICLSRRLLAGHVRRRYPVFINRLDSLLRDDVFFKVLLLRLQPLGTNLLTNLCVGFTHVHLTPFLLASALGYVPQMFIFTLLGNGTRVGSQTQLLVSLVMLAVSVLLGLMLYWRHRRRNPGTSNSL